MLDKIKVKSNPPIHYTNLGGQQRSKISGYDLSDKERENIVDYLSVKNYDYVKKESNWVPYFIYYED